MAGQLTRISGLWLKDTNRGPVISGGLKPDARAAILKALENPDDLFEIVIFQNDRRDKDTSPTHNLCIGAGRARTAQEPRAEKPATYDRQEPVRGPVEQTSSFPPHAGVDAKVDDPDDLPF
jgi:hypothetical protein